MAVRLMPPGTDLFASGAEALVNPVNTVGTMGKGLALAFKSRYPDILAPYVAACASAQLVPGVVQPTKSTYDGGKMIFNFPTKQDWRRPSNLTWIDQGLDSLVLTVEKLGIQTVAVPALGCGEGRLSWELVLPLLTRKLEPGDVVYLIHPPC